MFPDHFSLQSAPATISKCNGVRLAARRSVCLVERHLQLQVQVKSAQTSEITCWSRYVWQKKSSTSEKVPSPRWTLSYAPVVRAGPTTSVPTNPETHRMWSVRWQEKCLIWNCQHQLWLGVWYNQNCSLCWYMWYCIDVGGAMVTTTHSIHCAGSTSGSHELPPSSYQQQQKVSTVYWSG